VREVGTHHAGIPRPASIEGTVVIGHPGRPVGLGVA